MKEQNPIEPEIVDEIIDDINKEKNKKIEENKNKKIWAWILLVIATVYGISPIDLLPDAPVIGWIDDFTILSAAITNFIQQQFFQTNNALNKILKTVKYILISLAVLITLISVLILLLIIKS